MMHYCYENAIFIYTGSLQFGASFSETSFKMAVFLFHFLQLVA